VAIADNYTDRMSEVFKKLSSGMHVDQSLERWGHHWVNCAGKLQALSQVEGVLHVDPSQEIHLAPQIQISNKQAKTAGIYCFSGTSLSFDS